MQKIYLVLIILISACKDAGPNVLRFEDAEKATQLMEEQISLFRKTPSYKLRYGLIWRADGKIFEFNRIDFDTVKTETARKLALDSLNLTQADFNKIKLGALALQKMNVCKAVAVQEFYELNTYAFAHNCFSNDFDTSERWILLKSEVKDKTHRIVEKRDSTGTLISKGFYRLVLDENETLLLGY